jgi:hypothetical protein
VALYESASLFHTRGLYRVLVNDEWRERVEAGLRSGVWLEEDAHFLNDEEVAGQLGFAAQGTVVHYPRGGSVEPQRVLALFAQGEPARAEEVLGASLVHCRGASLPEDLQESLPLRVSRGQLSLVHSAAERALDKPVTGSGYLAPVDDERWVLGASYERYDGTEVEYRQRDHEACLAKVTPWAGDWVRSMPVRGGRASLRSLFADHFPVAGSVAPGRYVLTDSSLVKSSVACCRWNVRRFPISVLNAFLSTAPLSFAAPEGTERLAWLPGRRIGCLWRRG